MEQCVPQIYQIYRLGCTWSCPVLLGLFSLQGAAPGTSRVATISCLLRQKSF